MTLMECTQRSQAHFCYIDSLHVIDNSSDINLLFIIYDFD